MEENEKTQEEGKNLEGEETQEGEESPESDPLDEVEDVEELRKRAKGYRAERNRLKKDKSDDPKPKEEESKPSESEFLTKKDFQKANERKAMVVLQESDPFFKENREEIEKLYVSRRGMDTPEDIQEDLKDAITVFKARNPQEQEGNAEELTSTTGGGTASSPSKKPPKKEPKGFKLPTPPENWYPKKEE